MEDETKDAAGNKAEEPIAEHSNDTNGSGPAFIWAFVGGIVAVSILIGAIVQSGSTQDSGDARRQERAGPPIAEVGSDWRCQAVIEQAPPAPSIPLTQCTVLLRRQSSKSS